MKNDNKIFVAIFIGLVLLILPLINADDIQTITLCGGDKETLIHCSGDNELSYVARVEGSEQDIGEVATFGIQDKNLLFIILGGIFVISIITILIAYDLRKKRIPKIGRFK